MEISAFYEWCVKHAHSIDAVGEILTYAGGAVLAWEVIVREKEFREMKRTISSVGSRPLTRLKVEMEGISLSTEDDVQRVFIRRAKRKAILGIFLLSFGFVLLMLSRLVEHWKH